MEKDRSWGWVLGIGIFSLLYAVVRYHLFKGVPWEHFPLFIFNKAISLASVLLLALSFLVGPFRRLLGLHVAPSGLRFALLALVLAFQHGLMSLVLLRTDLYPQFFSGASLSGTGESSLLFGLIAFTAMATLGVLSLLCTLKLPLPSGKALAGWLKYGCLGLNGGHVLMMGWENWLQPERWPGSLLPISLLSFGVVTLTLAVRGLLRERVPGRREVVVRSKQVF
jgi:hypothetical protein